MFTVFLSVFLIGPTSAKKNLEISYQSLPNWVLDASVPDTNEKRIRAVSDGIYHLIDDTQIRIGARGADYFLRTTQKIIDRSGLEDASQIQLTFDPEIDNLVLHRVAVWRDGNMIDQTATASVEVMRRESELEEGIITGQRTAHLRLDDVRVGDVTDIAWSLNEKSSYWPGHFFGKYALGWSVPVAMTRLRVVMPRTLELNTKLSNGAPNHEETLENGARVLTWATIDPDPIPSEKDTPKWRKHWPAVQLSTMSDWSSVVSWALPFYDVDSSLPSDLAAKVDAIAASSADPKTRATKALWLVQDSVRYTSLSIGVGGYRPRTPAVTWKSGFGDCKDKTTLLIAVLLRLGIEAVPALTDTDTGRGLIDLQPRADAFDHVIVRADGLGKPIWLDPTGSHEGGVIPYIADQTYGFALPLVAGQTQLQEIPAPTPDKPTIDVVESHIRSDNGVEIAIHTTYRDDEANIKRASIADSSLSSLEKNEIEYYQDLFPGVKQRGELIVSDNRDQNILAIEQNYFLPATAPDYQDTITSYQINAWTLGDLFDTPDAAERKTALALPNQINRRHVFKLTTPGMRPELPDAETISSNAFDFNRVSTRNGDNAIIEMSLVGKTTILEAVDVAGYRNDTERLTNLSYEFIDLDDQFGFVGSELFLIIVGLALVGGIVSLTLAVQSLKSAEAIGTVSGSFRPMSISKFLVMSISTFGVYLFYWFWRCWRRHQQTEGVAISPFWRAFFSIFWVFELFKAARSKAELQKPLWLGVIVSIGYFLTSLTSAIVEQFDVQFGISSIAAIMGIVVLIPVVQQINSANDRELVIESGRYNKRDWLAVFCCLPFSIVLFVV